MHGRFKAFRTTHTHTHTRPQQSVHQQPSTPRHPPPRTSHSDLTPTQPTCLPVCPAVCLSHAGTPVEGAFSRKRSFRKKFRKYGEYVARGKEGPQENMQQYKAGLAERAAVRRSERRW